MPPPASVISDGTATATGPIKAKLTTAIPDPIRVPRLAPPTVLIADELDGTDMLERFCSVDGSVIAILEKSSQPPKHTTKHDRSGSHVS